MLIVGVDFEPALRWRKPAVDNCTHGKPPSVEPEGERLLFAAIARIAFNPNRHGLRIPPKSAPALDDKARRVSPTVQDVA